MNPIIASVTLCEGLWLSGLGSAMAIGWLIALALLERCYNGKSVHHKPAHQ